MGIELTSSAVDQIKTMLAKHELGEGYGLRVGVKAGGCAGREYVLDLVEGPTERDRIWEYGGIKVFCDPRSYLFINGLVLDFNNNMLGGNFVFNNPNASASCGCGTSFS